MRRLLPDTLAGRTIVILVVGLGLFHLWSIWIYQIGTENLLGPAHDHELADHLLATQRALGELAPEQREATAHALASPELQVHWSPHAPAMRPAADDERIAALRQSLQQRAPGLSEAGLRFGYTDDAATRQHLLLASLPLDDGSWVTFGLDAFSAGAFGAGAFGHGAAVEHDVVGSLTAMAAGILIVSILLVRTITAPLRDLARAAERIGTDLAAAGAPETGPREIRRVAGAFNTMLARIRRLIDDRTHTLAAVSHDLKTPLTRLRLRAEFVADGEVRRMIEADLDEMEHMLEQTLAFLRGDASQEESRTVDLASLLTTLCDQAADAGRDVRLSGAARAPLRCRPLALKRAFSNLIDNAVTYGGRARVSLQATPQEVRVDIDDDGPGIPASDHERVFEPFQRLEDSRNRETGGTGLGLTIARMAVRAHGGDVTLANQRDGGLRVTVVLPRPEAGQKR